MGGKKSRKFPKMSNNVRLGVLKVKEIINERRMKRVAAKHSF